MKGVAVTFFIKGPGLFEATGDDLERVIRQRPLQRLRFIPGRPHPDVTLLVRRQDHRHGLGMDRPNHAVRGGRQEPVNQVRPQAILQGRVHAFIGFGGNFIRAVPDTAAMEQAWRDVGLTVQVATKLNRSHIVHGKQAFLLPCLGRIERDEQATGPQAVAIEDATGCVHASVGHAEPTSPDVLSEPKIVVELAKATIAEKASVDWEWMGSRLFPHPRGDRAYPSRDLPRFQQAPCGLLAAIHRPLPDRVRDWRTPNKKANFHVPKDFFEQHEEVRSEDSFDLITLLSNDQFNTTIYGFKDRYREIFGTREVLLMNPNDVDQLGFRSRGRIRR
jgi:anaerobic selenocysteine-containing dehydrogenase